MFRQRTDHEIASLSPAEFVDLLLGSCDLDGPACHSHRSLRNEADSLVCATVALALFAVAARDRGRAQSTDQEG